jgi:hypothetical protein
MLCSNCQYHLISRGSPREPNGNGLMSSQFKSANELSQCWLLRGSRKSRTCASHSFFMVKRKTRHLSESETLEARRSGRSNAGRGGVSEQLEKLGTIFESPTKVPAKRGKVCVPDSEPVNAFAPKETQASNTRRTSKKKVI